MTLDQIFKLLDAGYTKEEINELHDLQQSVEPKPAKEPAADPEPKPAKEPAADPEPPAADPKPEPAPHYVDDIAKLTEQVKALTESMQEHFRNAAEGKKTGVSDGDSILKNILEKGEI